MMIRKQIHFTEQQLAALKEVSDRTGLSLAEIIRRATDDYLEKLRRRDKEETRGNNG